MRPVIGLLGGIGPASTAVYYSALVEGGRERLGRVPEIVVYSLDFDRFTRLEETDFEAYVALVRSGLRNLVRAGATVVAMAANSPHAAWDRIRDAVDVPIVDIVGPVARRAREEGLGRALLLGIPVTMRAVFYPDAFARLGLTLEIPDPRHHPLLRRVVFEELTHGVRSERSRAEVLAILDEHEVDALVLGCTELGDLIRPGDSPLPVLDSLRLHVDSILTTAASAT